MNFIKHNTFKIISFSFLLLIGVNVVAQTSDSDILKKVDEITKKMFVDLNNKDYDAILEMTHPKVFDIASKEQMKTVFKGMLEGNGDFSIEIPKEVPNYKLSKVYKETENNLDYVFVSYDMNMKMTFHKQEFDDASKKMMVSVMKVKDMDVKFISDNAMNIQMNNRITIILREDATKNKWVMVNYDPDSPLFYSILSSGLLTEAKEYKQNLMLVAKKESENSTIKTE